MALWNDAQYLKFGDERTRAARELLARVPLERAERVVDLGCGPGNSTALLSERWPNARLSGVDNSPEMLERARRDFPAIEWILGDAGSYRAPEPVDLLFANAVFHWLPDHCDAGSLRSSKEVKEGACLGGLYRPRASRSRAIAWSSRVRARMMPRRKEVAAATPVAGPAFYYDLLAPRATAVDIWRTTYEHVMPDAAAIVEWVKGTGLRPYLDDLTPGERTAYLAEYGAAIDVAYPARRDGKRLFSFPRLFIVAVR